MLAHYAVGDRLGEAYAMVNLVNQGWARQAEVARAFRCDVRTVRRNQRRAEEGGLAALGRHRGYPRGRPRTSRARDRKVERWKAEGFSNREIGHRLGVTEKAVRKALRRLGWKKGAEQLEISFPGADPKMSDPMTEAGSVEAGKAREEASGATDPGDPGTTPGDSSADPKVSASTVDYDDVLPVTLHRDPADRTLDRMLACLGLLDDAVPVFGPGTQVPGAGVLLALPALVGSGVIDVAREIYGSLGPAFFGLRTTMVTLLLMALLRIRRPEGLKEHPPWQLGRLLGLDRAPEMKTLRRKLTRLAAFGRAAQFGRALAERRVAERGQAMGFLYVDGHVRVYHGKRVIPKAHVARMRISMPGTTDYWVNDAGGDPLFVVPTEANQGLVGILPPLLEEVRVLVGERRVTVVFDRGGWSPALFEKLIAEGFDVLTYRKGRCRRVARKHFDVHEAP
ncbi:MAG: putative transposase, partial [Patescibacteria group bacterium]